MNCKICGSSEFCTNAGITFCTECNSQIEETQTETNVDLVFSKDLLSSPSVKKSTRDRRKEYSNWITTECFNHIIFMQVSALIKLGASPKLKKTVLHIWSKYLQKCEIAFRTDFKAEENIPYLGPVPLKRDIKILFGDKRISSRKRNNSVNLSLSEVASTEGSNVTDSEYVSDTNSNVSSDVVHMKQKYSSHAKKLLRKSSLKTGNRKIYVKQVFNMTLAKTLSICYLGLLYTEDQLALCDLIRFIYEDKMPYLNIIDKLPSYLKLQDTDTYTFLAYNVPDTHSVLKLTREIAQFLKLPKFKEPSVFLAVSRFVKDLNLPDGIKPIVKVLVEQYKEQLSNWTNNQPLENIPHDYQALAFIIIALKMLFVLDDKFEIEHSNVMNKLNAIHPEYNYFVWKEWREHSMVKEYLFVCETPGYTAINKLDGLNADKIISKYPFTRLKSPSTEEMHNPRDTLVIKNKIKNILSNVVSIPDKIEIPPTSFPLRSEINCFMEEWHTLPMYKETKNIDFTLLQKDFSSHSLSFNPLQFNKDNEELAYLLMTSLYLPEELGFFNNPTINLHSVITTTSKYWFFNTTKTGRSRFASDWLDKLPASFTWLINFISKYAYTNSVHLYKEILQIEKVLFLQKKRVFSQNLPLYKNKINIDF